MSQDTFPFAEGEDDGAFVDEAHQKRRMIMIGGGVAAALVLMAGGWFLLGGSGGSTDTSGTAFVPHGTSHRVLGGPPANALTTSTLPVAYTARLGRDPFKALYVVPAAAPAGTTTTTSAVPPAGSAGTGTGAVAPAGPASGSTQGSAPVSTTPASTTPASTAPAPAAPTNSRYTLKLVSISKPSPQARYSTWLVDGKSATVLPAQRFGKYGEIEVLAFSQNASGAVTGAIIQVGDDSPLDVPVGQSVSVL